MAARPEIAQALRRRPTTDTPELVTGADINPLPVDRALTLIESARQAPQTDPALIDALAQRLHELRPVDPFQHNSGVAVHGDAHLGNVLWHANGSIAALVDLEWARLGPVTWSCNRSFVQNRATRPTSLPAWDAPTPH